MRIIKETMTAEVSKKLRRQNLIALKTSTVEVLKTECDRQGDCKDKKGILIGVGSFSCKNVLFQFISNVLTKWVGF